MEDKQLLEKILETVEENNKILHGIRRGIRWSRFVHFVYWIVIIAGAVGAYYYIQPYVDQVLEIYGGLKGGLGGFLL